ncbi:MAG: AAA family ATPase [Capsulimonas sp.]|uniref:AAA family ATPase n=1 Tax=Capsulimonas sp. TaxID=2494211 RepID=UPI0032631355
MGSVSAMASKSIQELEVLLRARYPVIYVVTWEEGRVEEALAQIARRREKKLYLWSIARGLQPYGSPLEGKRRADERSTDPAMALDHVLESMENAIYVFRDLHPFFGSPAVTRRIRELASYLKNSYKTLVIIAPTQQIPIELQKDVTVVEFDLPDREDLGALLGRTLSEVNESTGRDLKVDAESREKILGAASGLTINEAENVFAKTLVLSGRLSAEDLPIILSEKEQTIRKSGLLEYYHADTDLGQLGGMDVLKDWLGKRSIAFDPEAAAFGLPAPKGVLLIGVQGCGKSLTAKAIAGFWGLPLLRLDVGRLFNSLVGSSEENVRMAIRVAESVAPAVLWVDEIEKSMSGSQSSGSVDGGTSARVLSTFLTWLQEKTAPVFVVATANSIDQLPPELLRRGRLDETFFVDLPDAGERREIFRIHLQKRGRDPEKFDIAALADSVEGFSGAEIEQCVIAGLFDAYSAKKALSTNILLQSIKDSVPLSRTMAEPIAHLRAWADGRARRASSITH